VTDSLSFTNVRWEADIVRRAQAEGTVASHWFADYFLFNKDLLPALPPFAVGRLTWDNWLLYEAKRREIPLIDASRVVLAIHQNHNYSYDKRLTRGGWNWEHPEVKANLALAGGQEHTRGIHDSDFVLGAVGVWPAWGREHLARRLHRQPFRPLQRTVRTLVAFACIHAALGAYRAFSRLRTLWHRL